MLIEIGMLLTVAGIIMIAVAGAVIYKSRSAGGESKEKLEELQRDFQKQVENFNSQMQSQTANLVETIGRVREESKTAINQSFAETGKNIDQKLSLGRKELDQKLGDTQKILSQKLEQLIKETADIRTASGTMLEVGQDIRKLSDILEGGQSRGSFGEYRLELLLKDVIPHDRLKFQYQIGDGTVDAAIVFEDNVLCIDSKFPLANLKKYHESQNEKGKDEKLLNAFYSDVKKRAKEISGKYIVPKKTLGFAIMFIPSESVFLEIVTRDDLHKELMDMNVIPASPNFLYTYLQALAIGFRGMAVEARANEIIRTIADLKIGFQKFYENFRLVGKHLENAQKQFGESERQAGKIEGTLENLQMGKPDQLEK